MLKGPKGKDQDLIIQKPKGSKVKWFDDIEAERLKYKS